MHVMIPNLTYEDRRRSLGGLALWWVETFCVYGRGDAAGRPVTHSPEYIQFYLNAYALKANGRRRFNRVSLWRPKGCNKSGLGNDLSLFEALGPCRFDHWAGEGESYTLFGRTYHYMPGEPVGRPVQHPKITLIATAEDQTGNIFDSIYYNLTSGPLAEFQGLGMVVTKTGVSLPDGGEISPATSGGASRDGNLESFAAADEIHEMILPKHHKTYKTVQRNLPKRSLEADPWILEMTTFFKPGLNSVAENTFKIAEDLRSGRMKHYKGLYFDYRYAQLPIEEFSDERKLRHALYESYGSAAHSDDGKDYVILPDGILEPVDEDGRTVDGWSLRDPGVEPGPSKDGWVDVEGLMGQIYQPDSDPNDSIRYFLNGRASSEDAWLTEPAIISHLAYKPLVDKTIDAHGDLDSMWTQVVGKDEEITLGFDGSIRNDSTALVGCRVRDGLLFVIKLQQKPDMPVPDWKVDRDGFDAAARRVFERYNVVGCFADAAYFENIIQGWETDYGRDMRAYARGSAYMMRFYTNNWSHDMYRALQNAHSAFEYDPVQPDDCETPDPENILLMADPRLVEHFRNAKRREKSFGYLIFKETPKSPHKIDATMAGVLAYAARQKYLGGNVEEQSSVLPQRIW